MARRNTPAECRGIKRLPQLPQKTQLKPRIARMTRITIGAIRSGKRSRAGWPTVRRKTEASWRLRFFFVGARGKIRRDGERESGGGRGGGCEIRSRRAAVGAGRKEKLRPEL